MPSMLLLLSACAHVVQDGGEPILLAPTALPGAFHVEVVFGGGDTPPVDATCELQATADGLLLTSSVRYPADRSPFVDYLISDPTSASCTITITEPGPLRITYGDDVFTLDVPGDGEAIRPLLPTDSG